MKSAVSKGAADFNSYSRTTTGDARPWMLGFKWAAATTLIDSFGGGGAGSGLGGGGGSGGGLGAMSEQPAPKVTMPKVIVTQKALRRRWCNAPVRFSLGAELAGDRILFTAV